MAPPGTAVLTAWSFVQGGAGRIGCVNLEVHDARYPGLPFTG